MNDKLNFPLREALTKYSEWLEKQGYMDCDWWAEEPGHETSVDRFLEESATTPHQRLNKED